MSEYGIVAYDAYLPKYRISRKVIYDAIAWTGGRSPAEAKGERTVCDWDEDSITMGIEAARGAIRDRDKRAIDCFIFASTSAPFADRQSTAVMVDALLLADEVATLDVGTSRRAATSALLTALKTAGEGETLIAAAEDRKVKSVSIQEMQYGDGAAALLLGRQNVIADVIGSYSRSCDFVDHFRSEGAAGDYEWEQRWVREEGLLAMVVDSVRSLNEKTGIKGQDIDYFILPSVLRGLPEKIAAKLAIRPEAVTDNMAQTCGDTGAAHPLLMLAAVLEQAQPGQKILLLGFGQGCDAICFETTAALAEYRPKHGVKKRLANKVNVSQYHKFLALKGLVDIDWGMRAEAETKTSLSSHYRNRRMLQSFVGGQCRSCQTIQYPQAMVCVNPECGAAGEMDDEPLADVPAHIVSFTIDWLGYSPNPPLQYGMVEFVNGAKVMMGFTSGESDKLQVGASVRAVFRIKAFDQIRNFRRYFWKLELCDDEIVEGGA